MSRAPDREPVVGPERRVTRPWLDFFQALAGGLLTIVIDLTTQVTGRLSYANLPVLEASRLLGRGSLAGPGDVEPITLGANLTMTGTVLSASGGGGGGSPADGYWAPLTDGDLDETDLIFASGQAVMLWVPTP